MKGFIPVLAALLAVATLSATAVLAAPGGNGNGKAVGHATGGAPTLTVTPNPHADVGQWVTVAGEGFPKDAVVGVVITDMPTIGVRADRAGSFETGVAFAEAGSYTFSACYLQKNGRWDCNSTPPVTLEVVE
jgi:hypothetical protein